MDLYPQHLASHFANDCTFASLINVEVKIKPAGLFSALAEEYKKEINRLIMLQSFEVNIDVVKYFKTLLKLHIDNVNGSVHQSYRPFVRTVEVPAIFATFLANIGRVTDKDFGISFWPSFNIEADELLSPSELADYSGKLLSLYRIGLATVQGLPNPSDSGSLGTMACSLVENGDVLSYRHDHPVYGFISAVFNFNATEEVLGLKALRVRYGSLSEYDNIIHTVFRSVR